MHNRHGALVVGFIVLPLFGYGDGAVLFIIDNEIACVVCLKAVYGYGVVGLYNHDAWGVVFKVALGCGCLLQNIRAAFKAVKGEPSVYG